LNHAGIGLYGANNNLIENNEAEGNASAGFFVGFGATGNTLSQNHAEENDGDGILVEADDNVIEQNHSNENGGIGIAIDGDGNTIERNHAKENGVSDIQNTGDNTYTKNKCDSSSGPPVDCGASPSFTHEEITPLAQAQPFE
jgi:parallel beta-helix repeat protein